MEDPAECWSLKLFKGEFERKPKGGQELKLKAASLSIKTTSALQTLYVIPIPGLEVIDARDIALRLSGWGGKCGHSEQVSAAQKLMAI